MRKELQKECARCAEDFQAKLVEARSQWAREHADELLRVKGEYQAQLEAGERAWQDRMQSCEDRAREDVSRAQRQLSENLDAHVAEVDCKIVASRDAELAQLQRRLEDIEEASAALHEERAPLYQQLQRKLDASLMRLQEQDNGARRRRDELHAREMEMAEAAVHKERLMHGETCDHLESAHVRQIEVMLETLYEHQQEVEQGRKSFEETLQSKYLSMLAALKDQVRLEQEAQVRRALDALEKTVRAESKRTQQAYSDQSRAELTAAMKFKGLVAKLRKLWQAEEATRSEALEQRLHTHYNMVLRHMQTQLDMALRLHAEADQQWIADIQSRHSQQMAALRAYETKCRQLYDTRLREYTELTRAQLAHCQEELLQTRNGSARERTRLESRVWRLKSQCSRWRADLVAATQERFHKAVGELETRYMTTISQLTEELTHAREALSLHELQLRERDHAIEETRSSLRAAEQRAAHDRDHQTHGQRSYRELYAAVVRLWAVLDVPADEQGRALHELMNVGYSQATLLTKLDTLRKQLSAQVPIQQLVTRREWLKYRLTIAHAEAGNGDAPTSVPEPTASDTGAGANSGSAMALAELKSSLTSLNASVLEQELASLTTTLRGELATYEQTFGSDFLYHGSRYVIDHDASAMAMRGDAAAATQNQNRRISSVRQPFRPLAQF